MTLLAAFFLSAFFSGIGVLPPGMLNMTAANISIRKSFSEAKKFIYGTLLIVSIQSFIGFYFATFLESHPQVTQHLKLVGSIIFSALTLFFLGKAIQSIMQSSKIESNANISRFPSFTHGVVLSAINVFPIPYYAFLSLYFSAFLVDFFSMSVGIAFVMGSVLGTGLVYGLYAFLFKRLEHKVSFFIKNVNFIIAAITGLVAFFTIYNL